jgi:flagellar hook protein FlgE
VNSTINPIQVTPGGGASNFTLTPGFDRMGQLSGEYSANVESQDGFPYGTLQSYSIGQDGTVAGIFSNGLNRALGKIAMAQFANPAGLEKMGSNLYRTTGNSGQAQILSAGSSGAGKISAGFLEQSNVNLADEFSNMIITQRGFQANTKIVTAADELLQDIISMKR